MKNVICICKNMNIDGQARDWGISDVTLERMVAYHCKPNFLEVQFGYLQQDGLWHILAATQLLNNSIESSKIKVMYKSN